MEQLRISNKLNFKISNSYLIQIVQEELIEVICYKIRWKMLNRLNTELKNKTKLMDFLGNNRDNDNYIYNVIHLK